MQTPRFPIIAAELNFVLSAASFSKVWKSNVRQRLKSWPLRDPIDHFDFHINLSQNTTNLATRIQDARYQPSPHKRHLEEKSKGLCRQIVSPAVDDCLVLQVLSDYLYREIKDAQPTQKAYFEPDDGAFNKKFEQIAASPYGSIRAWIEFQARLFEFTKEYEFIVVTDVANYYDFIKYDQLRNVISGITGKSESTLDLLIFVLSGLCWQPDYMPRQLTGLPQIDLDAPRLLAHCFLFDVDRFILERAKLDHVRFMDDIDVGANSIAEAKKVLRDIDLIVQSRQVRLNSGKTKILRSAEAFQHFRVKENHVLSKWQKHLDWKVSNGLSLKPDRDRLVKIVALGLAKGRFDDGNGDKILKRLLTTATKIGAEVRLKDIESIVRLRPGVRSAGLRHFGMRTLGLADVRMLHRCVMSDAFIDDLALFSVTRLLLESRVRHDVRVKKLVREICDKVFDYSEYGIFLAQRLSAKFLTPGQTVHFTGARRKVWVPDPVLGRQMAAVLPFFFGYQGVWPVPAINP